MSEKTDIKSMDLEELKTFFSDMGEKMCIRDRSFLPVRLRRSGCLAV